MEILFTIITYIAELIAIYIIPIILFIVLRIFSTKKRAAIVSLAAALVVTIGTVYIVNNPIIECPDEYKQYLSDIDLLSLHAYGGYYAKYIPAFIVKVAVTYADESMTRFKVVYYPYGSAEFELADKFECVKPLFKH